MVSYLCLLLSILAHHALSFSVWQKGRVVVTREMMAFLNPGDDEIIDRILLYEIESIQDMAKFNVGVDAASFAFAIIITTLQKGRNNGRTYYLQAESREDCAQLVSQLSRLSKAAAKRAETSHLFAKIRVASRTAYHSPYFQEGTALLILAVSDSPRAIEVAAVSHLVSFNAAEFRYKRPRRPIFRRADQTGRLAHVLGAPGRHRQQPLHLRLRHGAALQHLRQLLQALLPQRLELVRRDHRPRLPRRAGLEQLSRLARQAHARLPRHPPLRPRQGPQDHDHRRHRLHRPDDERLRHPHHPPLHLCVPPARRPSARPSPFPFFGARFGDAARR